MSCYSCGKTADLRPYGPKGQMTCFACAMSTPATRLQAEQQFAAQLAACGPGPVVIGGQEGPYPARHNAAEKRSAVADGVQ